MKLIVMYFPLNDLSKVTLQINGRFDNLTQESWNPISCSHHQKITVQLTSNLETIHNVKRKTVDVSGFIFLHTAGLQRISFLFGLGQKILGHIFCKNVLKCCQKLLGHQLKMTSGAAVRTTDVVCAAFPCLKSNSYGQADKYSSSNRNWKITVFFFPLRKLLKHFFPVCLQYLGIDVNLHQTRCRFISIFSKLS